MRVELHAYDKDRSKPTPAPYKHFKTTIRKNKGNWVDLNKFFKLKSEPKLESWKFNWTDSIETQYASDLQNGRKPVEVAVASRAWRKLKLTEPGTYEVKVQYGPKKSYTVQYEVVQVTLFLCLPRIVLITMNIAQEAQEESKECYFIYF